MLHVFYGYRDMHGPVAEVPVEDLGEDLEAVRAVDRIVIINGQGGRRGGPVEMIIWWGTFICMAGAGTIVFHYGIQKAKRKSLRSMKSFEKPGEEWNPKKMKKYVKHAYFVIQECWRRQDTSYAEKYLSKNLIQNWNSKLGWMEVNHESQYKNESDF